MAFLLVVFRITLFLSVSQLSPFMDNSTLNLSNMVSECYFFAIFVNVDTKSM